MVQTVLALHSLPFLSLMVGCNARAGRLNVPLFWLLRPTVKSLFPNSPGSVTTFLCGSVRL